MYKFFHDIVDIQECNNVWLQIFSLFFSIYHLYILCCYKSCISSFNESLQAYNLTTVRVHKRLTLFLLSTFYMPVVATNSSLKNVDKKTCRKRFMGRLSNYHKECHET